MQLSIIIPTFNERENVEPIVKRISSSLKMVLEYEIWFIDDSTDDTPSVLERICACNQHVHFIHRSHSGGLASAVVDGIGLSKGKYVIVMDGDLQHPPELLPVLLQRLEEGIDIVIPSRFVDGGSDGGLGLFRKWVSWTARMFGQIALRKLRKISDCTGGYFGFHRSVIDGVKLSPIGWKILIEILVKGNYQTVHEVPYAFQARDAGMSKMTLREQFNYIHHIFKLVLQSDEDRRFFSFCLVGLSGVIVNVAALSLFIYLLHVREVPASILASFIAMVSNFIWNDRITWRDRSTKNYTTVVRLPMFVLISVVGITLTTLIMDGLHRLNIPVLIGQCVGIFVATFWSYHANNRFTWKGAARRKQRLQPIIVTKESKRLKTNGQV